MRPAHTISWPCPCQRTDPSPAGSTANAPSAESRQGKRRTPCIRWTAARQSWAGESAMDRKRGEGRGAGCRTPGVSAGAVMMPHRLLALLGVLGACLTTSGPAHAVTVTLPSAQDSWLGQDAPHTNHRADSHMHVPPGVGKVRAAI